MNCKRCGKRITEYELFEPKQVMSFGETQIRELYECSECEKINVQRIKLVDVEKEYRNEIAMQRAFENRGIDNL